MKKCRQYTHQEREIQRDRVVCVYVCCVSVLPKAIHVPLPTRQYWSGTGQCGQRARDGSVWCGALSTPACKLITLRCVAVDGGKDAGRMERDAKIGRRRLVGRGLVVVYIPHQLVPSLFPLLPSSPSHIFSQALP